MIKLFARIYIFVCIHMLAASQTAGPNWLLFFMETMGTIGVKETMGTIGVKETMGTIGVKKSKIIFSEVFFYSTGNVGHFNYIYITDKNCDFMIFVHE